METKTYGVPGYIDIQLRISVGNTRASVRFSGGSMTAFGVNPAEYTTSDPAKQKMIEMSRQFKEGRIKLLRTSGTPDRKPVIPKTVSTQPNPVIANPAPKVVRPEQPAGQAPGIDSTEEVVDPTEVSVNCLTEAQEYLRDAFGIPTSKSRSIERAQKFAKENGVKFTGLGD